MIYLLIALSLGILAIWLVTRRPKSESVSAPVAADHEPRAYKATVEYDGIRIVSLQKDAQAELSKGNFLVLVANAEKHKWLVFICPCGCGSIRRISVSQSVQPAWRLKIANGKISLSPSVNLRDECRAHFFLRNNVASVISSDHL